MDRVTGQFRGNVYSLGAMGDSYYEYLLKGWLQSGKRDKVRIGLITDNQRLKRLYDRSVDGMYEMLFGKSKKDDYLFVGEKKGNRVIKKMEQMTCFASAMLALGADNEENPERRERDFQRARGLAWDVRTGCYAIDTPATRCTSPCPRVWRRSM